MVRWVEVEQGKEDMGGVCRGGSEVNGVEDSRLCAKDHTIWRAAIK